MIQHPPSPRGRIARCALLVLGLAASRASADSVIGQVINQNGVGLVGVTLKFSNGLPNAVTGVNGLFAVTVPAGTYDIAFEPATTYAPRIFLGVPVAGTANMGSVRLEFGFPVSGQVVNNANVALVNANIDVYDQATGVKLYTPGDGTDLLGNFTVTVPVGTCRVRVKPPSGVILVSIERRNVVVNAAVALGQIALQPGVLITGIVIDGTTLAPVPDVDLDITEALSGLDVVTPDDNTTSTGTFSVIAPPTLLHVAFDPPAGNSLLGKVTLNLYAPGPRNLGTVTLARGSLVRGRVLAPGNVPIANADLDVEVGNYEVYLSHDKTDANGNFEIVVPDGAYRFMVEPPAAVGVIGLRTALTTVAGTTVLPDFVLPAGVRISGVVRGPDGTPEAGVDLDFIDPVSRVELVTPGDHTDASGAYDAVVLNGTWDVELRAVAGSQSQTEVVPGLLVNGNTTFDRQLARVPVFVRTQGLGVPTAAPGSTVPMVLTIANPNATVTMTRLSLWFIDPSGLRFPLLTNLDLPLPPGFVSVSLLFMPVPPVNPIDLGKPFALSVQFDDPVTGAEHDRDAIKFIIQ